MNLNDLMKLMLNNIDNLKIEYSNVNGKESLKINDKEICRDKCGDECKCSYDDTELINKIENHKELLNSLDDCTFMEVVDYLKNQNINLKALNEFMDKSHYSEKDEITADNYIRIVSNAMRTIIYTRMKEFELILKNL